MSGNIKLTREQKKLSFQVCNVVAGHKMQDTFIAFLYLIVGNLLEIAKTDPQRALVVSNQFCGLLTGIAEEIAEIGMSKAGDDK